MSRFRVVISQTLQVIAKACLLPEPHSGLAHGLGRSFDGGKSWKHPVACVCLRAAFGCAAELWRNLLPFTIAIRIRFAALRVSRCGHRLYKTMFGFPSGACYMFGELGVAKCRASRSSEHSCKGKCSRSLCFCCSFSFACLCALGSQVPDRIWLRAFLVFGTGSSCGLARVRSPALEKLS